MAQVLAAAGLKGRDALEFVKYRAYLIQQVSAGAEDQGGGAVYVNEERRASMLGSEIQRRFERVDFAPNFVGRRGGVGGTSFEQDVTSGHWRTRAYAVSYADDPPGSNWFSIDEFVHRVRGKGGRLSESWLMMNQRRQPV